MAGEDRILANGARHIDFQTDPSRYRHWKLEIDGDVATLTMDVDENGGLFEGFGVMFGDVESSDYIVCSGLFDDETENAETYRATLTRARERNLDAVIVSTPQMNPMVSFRRRDLKNDVCPQSC